MELNRKTPRNIRRSIFGAVALSLAVVSAMPGRADAQATMAPGDPAMAIASPQAGGPDAAWRDAGKSIDERAKDLLNRLTLEEKISLLHADGTFTSPGLPRFNIPKLWMSDGPQGVREEIQSSSWNNANASDDFATAMPASIGLAASFDPELAKAFGGVIGDEARTRGKHIMLCPGLNIMRTPLNGRNSEYFGEDPFLTSRIAVGFITAVQERGVAACAKHYAMNNQEVRRGTVNVHIDERTMREIYLPAFKASVTEAHVWSIMSAYNRVNGEYCAENDFLLNQVLKKEWGFPGLVMTDWSGCHSTVASANNGLDLEMGTNVGRGDHAKDFLATPLLEAVKAGEVKESRIDQMAMRNLRVMAFVGNLDQQKKAGEIIPMMAPAHIEIARQVAEAGSVLLKNDNQVLPIDPSKIKSVAVIGANAQAEFAHQGNSAQIKTKYEITPYQGITKRAGDAIKITYAAGYMAVRPRGGRRGLGGAVNATQPENTTGGTPELTAEAVAAAKSADMVILVAGLYRGQDQEGADRPNMELPPGQAELIAAVVKANPKTVVVLNGGSPSVVSPWIDDVAGLMMYWYGGTEGGNGLARLLFGDVNPAGHLPCTWPKQLSDSPAHAANDVNAYPGTTGNPGAAPNAGSGMGQGQRAPLTPETGPQQTYGEGIFVGYRAFDKNNIEPQFPFGLGLSYTTFQVADLSVTKGSGDGVLANVKVNLSNTGSREGADVVQVYVGQNNPSVPRPMKELKGFKKLSLKAGEKGTASIDLSASAFAYYDVAKHAWVADAGEYTIYAGDSSRNLPVKATFTLPQAIEIKEGM